uniref:Uncharacterized protein n=1 Tax=viral metagenome TaxID=1070528 RepID=A0A6M3LTJ5_9ZZZZ
MDEGQRRVNAKKKKYKATKGRGSIQWVHTNIPELELLLGPKVTADLIHYFGGCYIYVPSAQRIRANIMREKVCDMYYNQGKSKPQIEEELGWGPFNIVNRNRLNRYLNSKKGLKE